MSRIARYVVAIATVSFVAGVLLYLSSPGLHVGYWTVALVFGSISLLARLLSHRIGKETTGSLAFIPMLASATMAPSWETMVAVAGSVLIGQLVARSGWQKTLFNSSQYALSIAVAI